VPIAHRELAVAVCRDHLLVHRARHLRPATLLRLIERLRGFRDGPFFEQALAACGADARGRTGYENADYPSAEHLRGARAAAARIRARDVIEEGMKGPEIGESLAQARVAAIKAWREGTSKG
ncbi:MAG: multifunctional CCA addition/repair protein, partial [Algiphilus sp.]